MRGRFFCMLIRLFPAIDRVGLQQASIRLSQEPARPRDDQRGAALDATRAAAARRAMIETCAGFDRRPSGKPASPTKTLAKQHLCAGRGRRAVPLAIR
jgi:hypothetical protein